MTAAVKRATYEDLLSLPDAMVGEIVDGVLHANPRPGNAHTQTASILGEELGPPFRRGRGGPGGSILADEPELHLGGHVLVPDLASWKREGLAVVDSGPFIDVAPDWVCEVLSPRTAKLDRAGKLPVYAKEGVSHAWLVDPLERTLAVFRRHDRNWLLVATFTDDERVHAEPFDAIELDLSVLWADVARKQMDI